MLSVVLGKLMRAVVWVFSVLNHFSHVFRFWLVKSDYCYRFKPTRFLRKKHYYKVGTFFLKKACAIQFWGLPNKEEDYIRKAVAKGPSHGG